MTPDDNQKPEPETPQAEDAVEPKAEPKAKPKAASKPKVEAQEPVFTHSRLVRECAQAIGYPSHVVSGALAGVSKKTLTINEAKSACDKWLKAQKR